MRPSIRGDIHARFVAIAARAEARLRDEEKAVERTLTTALVRESSERMLAPPLRRAPVRSVDTDPDGD